ncbi:MAG: DUF3043 domain-containing protein [Actinomycetales bacterium]|nr:DUF3043 domain-containing protein [Actinomycetales bacterium]
MPEAKNESPASKAAGKGRPTPTRKEREAAARKPLVGERTPEARKAQRAAEQEARRKAREGMMAGDERYLTARDRGPQRRLARDIVDSRFTVGELLMPALFVIIIVSALPDKRIELITLFIMWGLFIALAIDGMLIGRKVQKRLAEKYGEDKVERGLRWYAAMRSIQMRMMRLPKPQVKRGTKI